METFERVVAVVLAAGSSTRMGGRENKILRHLSGKPVLAYSLDVLQKSKQITQVVVTCRQNDKEQIASIVSRHCPKAAGHVIEGGAERFDSVHKGLEYSAAFHPEAVLIHDAARLFLEEPYIVQTLQALSVVAGSIVGIPLKDTLKETDTDGHVKGTLERSRYWQSQTPQTFRFEDIYDAYCDYRPPPFPTDDGAVLEAAGRKKVKMVMGSSLNIKLTTPEDWLLAEAIIQIRQAEQEPSMT